MAQTVKNLPTMQETWVRSLGSGRSPGEGNGNPLQYSCLDNSMDGGAWQAMVHGLTRAVSTQPEAIVSSSLGYHEVVILLLFVVDA